MTSAIGRVENSSWEGLRQAPRGPRVRRAVGVRAGAEAAHGRGCSGHEGDIQGGRSPECKSLPPLVNALRRLRNERVEEF